MIVAFIMLLLLAAILFAWKDKRFPSILLFAMSLILSIGWFIHHITSTVGLSL
jgi:hypothetical protein